MTAIRARIFASLVDFNENGRLRFQANYTHIFDRDLQGMSSTINRFNYLAATAFFVLVLFGNSAFGVTTNLNPAKDNTLFEDVNGTLSNGAGPGFFAGRTVQGSNEIRRGLIMFDIAAAVPASATVTAATLTLNVSKVANASFNEETELRRANVDWGEGATVGELGGGMGGAGGIALPGDATWTHSFSPNTTWSSVGGDFSNVVSASTRVGDVGSYDWSDAQLTADIQDMLDSAHNNFGWFILGNESASQTARRFDSRDSANPPVLTI